MPFATRSGSEVALHNLICYAARKGLTVAVACRSNGELLEQLPPSVPVFVHETSGIVRRSFASLSRRVQRDADGFPTLVHAKFKPDIWYVNTILQPWILSQAAKKGIPSVLHTYELEQVFARISEPETNILVTSPRLVVACSETARSVIHTLGRSERLEVNYPGIDPLSMKVETEKSRQLRKSLGIGDDTFLWIMAGTMDPNKNPLRFVELAGEMLSRDLDLHFLWVASGHNGYSAYVRSKARELGTSGKVTFVDASGADYYAWLNAADGAVITSFKESFSLVAAEAAHLGKPVVSFDSGGVKEIVREGMGKVIDSWNNADLISAMISIMNGELFFDPAIARARVQEFSIEVQGAQWLDIMRRHFADAGASSL